MQVCMKDFRHSQTDVLGTMTSHVHQVRNWNSFPASQQTQQADSIAQISSSTTTHVGQGVGEVPRVYGVDSSSSLSSDNRSAMVENIKTWNSTTTKKKKIVEKKYRRYEKPPYSYVGLIALAIRSSTNQMLKLSEVLARISSMFPFFKGEYQGWRDSVRHNLSQNKCFKKVLQDPSRPHSKGNYWTVDVTLIPAEKLKRQNTSVSRNVAPGYTYARDLTEIFDLETGKLKVSKSVGSQYGFHEDYIDRQQPDHTSTTNVIPSTICGSNNYTSINANHSPPSVTSASVSWQNNQSGFRQTPPPRQSETSNSLQVGNVTNWKTPYAADSTLLNVNVNQRKGFNNNVTTKPQYNEPLVCSDLVSLSTDALSYAYPSSAPNCDQVTPPSPTTDLESRASVDSPVPTDSSDDEKYPSAARTMTSEQPKLSAINMERIIKRKRHSRNKRMANKKIRVSRSRSSLENKSGSESYSQSGSPESTQSHVSTESNNNTMLPTPQAKNIDNRAKNVESPPNTLPPPNQKPFGDNQTKQAKSPDNNKKPKFWSNIDQTVGPEGPPNITWTSSNPLQAVKPYFEPSIQSEIVTETSSNQWTNAVDLNDNHLDNLEIQTVEPINNDNQFAYKQGGLVNDQSEFLKQQAGIVTGRTNNSPALFNPRLLPPYRPLSNMQTHPSVYGHSLQPTAHNFYPPSNYPTFPSTIPNPMYGNTYPQTTSPFQQSTSPYLPTPPPLEENLPLASKLGATYPALGGFYPNAPTWPTHQMQFVDSGYAGSFLPPHL